MWDSGCGHRSWEREQRLSAFWGLFTWTSHHCGVCIGGIEIQYTDAHIFVSNASLFTVQYCTTVIGGKYAWGIFKGRSRWVSGHASVTEKQPDYQTAHPELRNTTGSMKFPITLVLLLFLYATQVSALTHRVRLWMVKTGGDQSNPVEVRAFVTFKYPTGNAVRDALKFYQKNKTFGGSGSILMDTTFGGNPLDITLRVYEDDSQEPSGNDGICYLVFRPHYVVGHTDYLCIREKDNGLVDDWKVRMRIDMF